MSPPACGYPYHNVLTVRPTASTSLILLRSHPLPSPRGENGSPPSAMIAFTLSLPTKGGKKFCRIENAQ